MGRSVTQVASVATSSGGTYKDPFSQPCFSVYSLEHSNGGGGFFSYDHNLNLLTNVRGSGSNHYGSYRTQSSQASEFMDNYASHTHYETQGTSNSNSERPSITAFVGYLGHIMFTPAQQSGFGGWLRCGPPGANHTGHAFRDCNVIVNETKQDWAWFQRHEGGTQRLRFSQRSANTYYSDHSSGYGGYLNVSCKWSTSMYGSACYNKKTNKIAMMETNTSHSFKPIIYSNVPDLRAISTNCNPYYNRTERNDSYDENSTGELYDYFNNSANYSTAYAQTSGKPTNQADEDNYRCITVLCDNDVVVMFQMIPHYGCWTHRWSADGTSQGNIWSASYTTSYGYEQGQKFGARWQVTSDGKYVWAYCPAYYYGSGIMGIIVRVSDGKIIITQHNDSTYGHQPCPVGKSDFLMARQINTDGGQGMYYRMIRVKREFDRLNDTANFNSQDNMMTRMIDTPFYSTAYPALIPAYYDTDAFNTQLPDAELIGD